jgi:hypothetical protein
MGTAPRSARLLIASQPIGARIEVRVMDAIRALDRPGDSFVGRLRRWQGGELLTAGHQQSPIHARDSGRTPLRHAGAALDDF